MELKIKTEKLKEMIGKAVRGASNNKLIPLTSLICIQLEGGKLTLITTDATNYLYVTEDKVAGDDFYVVIEVDTFSKLIARMTSETVTLTLGDSALEVKGNGTYQIELPLDEEGELIKYPNPMEDLDMEDGTETELHASTVATLLDTIRPALATTVEMPYYTGYYIGDMVIGTDTYKVASMAVKLLDEPMLISQEMMNLLAVVTSEKINVRIKDNVLVFTTPDVTIYGTAMEDIEEYQVDAISELIAADFKSTCKINKNALLQVLDRLSLFVGAYDKNAVNLTFTKEGLQISSKSSSGVEIIPYTESKKFKAFACTVDVTLMATQIKAYQSDVVTMHYNGERPALKFTDGNITQIIAFLSEDEE